MCLFFESITELIDLIGHTFEVTTNVDVEFFSLTLCECFETVGRIREIVFSVLVENIPDFDERLIDIFGVGSVEFKVGRYFEPSGFLTICCWVFRELGF